MARTPSSAARRTKAEPFKYGYRYATDGRTDSDIVPLSQEDLLHPQEGDFIVNNDEHYSDVYYLVSVFRSRAANRSGIVVLGDYIIDFQHGGVQPLGPDVTVLSGAPRSAKAKKATYPVVDNKARVHFVIEVTSASTRRNDLGPKVKLYYRAGVPLYLIADAPYGGSKKPKGLLAYRAGPSQYEPAPLQDGRFWLEVLNVWLGIENGRPACFDAAGNRLSGLEDTIVERDHARLERDQEKARVDQEKARADQEKARADQEKARAEAAEAELRELKELVKKSRRGKK